MRVKICGIRNAEEARLALDCGADVLGFLCGLNYPTDDELDPPSAQRIIANLPPFVSTVLVTHQTHLDWVVQAYRQIGCNTIQLHGNFSIEGIPLLRRRVPGAKIIKAVSVVDESAIAVAKAAARHADAVLLDSRTAARIGGTGQTHDWNISARIVTALGKPVILAGGLTPENIRKAIETVRPFAVDVNSGVESTDGSKSPERMRNFVRLAEAGFTAAKA
jgi:phosphoribosylanthranilate isomerase